MRRRHLAELFFELDPDRHWIHANVLAGDARQEDLAPVLRLEVRTEDVRQLESALVIDFGDLVPSKHETPRPLLHFFPQKSTDIVGVATMGCQRKIQTRQ